MNPIPCAFSPACVDGRIEEAIGKPWVPLGRTVQEGFDCWGFVRYALDLTDAPNAPFFNVDNRPGNIREFSKAFVKVADKTNYSIALMGTKGQFHHVGVYLPTGYIYHCMEKVGVCGHRFRSLGILGFDSFEFYRWEANAQAQMQNQSVRQS